MYCEKTIKRFLSYVSIQPNGCHLWTGATRQSGKYGVFWDGKKYVSSHRFAWEVANGEIPTGKLILHKCDVPSCVNPAHLYAGTQSENILDAVSRGRLNRTTRARGERSGRAILSEQQAVEILASKERIATLAKRYGVHWMTIKAIISGKSWKHLPRS